jgi:hypothetical protein
LPVVLYECETWSLALREEHRREVFENRVLRRRPKGDEIIGGSRKLNNDELHDLYLVLVFVYNQNDQVREDEMGRTCSKH